MAWDIMQVGPLVLDFNYLRNILIGFVLVILIAAIGHIVGTFIGRIVKKGVGKTKIEKWIYKNIGKDALGGIELNSLLGGIAKWWIFSFGLLIASDAIGGFVELEEASLFLYKLSAQWIPQLIGFILLVLVGLILAEFAAKRILSAKKLKGIRVISSVTKIIIILVFVIESLRIFGIHITIAEYSWYIILGGVMLALGIGFGLALKGPAERLLTDIEKKL